MCLVYFCVHPLIDLTVPTILTPSSLGPINIRGKVKKVNYNNHILLFIPIEYLFHYNKYTLNDLIPFFIWISNYFSRKYFVPKICCCTIDCPELVAFLHRLILHPKNILTLNFLIISSICTVNPGHIQRLCNTLFAISIRVYALSYHLVSRGDTSSSLLSIHISRFALWLFLLCTLLVNWVELGIFLYLIEPIKLHAISFLFIWP